MAVPGKIGWQSNSLKYAGRPEAHIIEVLSEKASNTYRAILRRLEISYIVAGQEQLDCKLAAEKLKALFWIDTLMFFLQAGLVDELSLIIAPLSQGKPFLIKEITNGAGTCYPCRWGPEMVDGMEKRWRAVAAYSGGRFAGRVGVFTLKRCDTIVIPCGRTIALFLLI
ncbi:hypothetical protein [Pseudomonas sp. NY15354]|uniref:hypothetical protein n=1 Tax=Pseudomonas sp. NY15354 TaxID=3400351 RepID=UPI003A8399EC